MAQLLSFDDWLNRKLDDLPEQVALRDGRTVSSRDYLTSNPDWLMGLYNREVLSPSQQQQAPLLFVETAGVGTTPGDFDEQRMGRAPQSFAVGNVPQVRTLDERRYWNDTADQQSFESRLFDITQDQQTVVRPDLAADPTGTVLKEALDRNKVRGSMAVADALGTAALRGYLSAAGSSINEPSRSAEFFFGRFGQPFTEQGRAQTDMAQRLGDRLITQARSGEAGLLGRALSVLPDPILRNLPVAANVIGGVVGDALSLYPARFAWRANPFDFGSTFLARDYAEKQGLDAARATGNLENRAYNRFQDPTLTATFSNLKSVLRRDPAPLLKLGIGAGIGTTALLSGNLGGWQGPDEGFRRKGYAAVSSSSDDPRKTDNVLMSLVSPLTGGSNRLLPWDQFTQEQPGISREKYESYKKYLRGDTDETEESDFSLFGGLIKGTMENLDGSPELIAVGGRITPLGVAGGLAAGAGAIKLLSGWINPSAPTPRPRPAGVR